MWGSSRARSLGEGQSVVARGGEGYEVQAGFITW